MATTTPNFGWPVPTSTDLVKDGATAIEALGDGIDTSLVDLKGGTTGQVLAKASSADMDFSWVAADDTNAIQNSIVDAKGDLIAATANDTPARLAVGADGSTLVANSAAATGLAWAMSPAFAAGKNKIINGDFGIWQRGTSFNANGYSADRFFIAINAGSITVTRSTAAPLPVGGEYFARATAAANNSNVQFLQALESDAVIPLRGQTMTFSAFVRGSFTGQINLNVQYSNSTDALLSQTTVVSRTDFSISTTFTRQKITFTVPNDAVGLRLEVNTTSTPINNTQTLDVFGIQLEAGSVATPFQTATGTIQGELAACQRYYYRVTNPNSTSDAMMPTGFAVATTQANMWMPAPVSMRVTPTVLDSANIRFFDGVNIFTPTLSISAGSEKVLGIAGVTSGLTQFRPYYALAATGVNQSFLGWSAEL